MEKLYGAAEQNFKISLVVFTKRISTGLFRNVQNGVESPPLPRELTIDSTLQHSPKWGGKFASRLRLLWVLLLLYCNAKPFQKKG